ncbi:aminoglycoside phosphotransferase family protein [Galbitalea sp. SE-J8]|uniref:phosphotransferase family protein n=1 Tax=Galbitalea sp. SE-J8 TaxID=3054952 RepID=UPI00259CA517|nr:aminoglycoside phosphotransferase family protein [Galbitalea sp. SE-J8]MDM4761998.1 aminoglycoside phosphotransferase family protein [Galbitalea sp. SE-J8]
MPIALLDTTSAEALLRQRGLVRGPVRIRELSGGVSNVVLAVEADGQRLVMKQSLERLRVEAEWLAPRRRILAEAAGLRVAAALDPASVPRVVDIDPETMLLVMEMAPEGTDDWKRKLMAGEIDADFARHVGRLVGRMHAETAGAPLPRELTDDPAAFEALRLDPYHEAVARALPELADAVRAVADRIRRERVCLVHGDLSPKNVLVLPGGAPHAWLIDLEVAHRGDPAFDVAFMLTHLVMKAVHRRADRARYDAAADAFLAGYAEHRRIPDDDALLPQLGCLLLARVVGKSPADYLSPPERDVVRALGAAAVTGGAGSLNELRERRSREWDR